MKYRYKRCTQKGFNHLMEHRYVMLNELLYLEYYFPNEIWIVHHKDGDGHNNNKDNLEIMNTKDHAFKHNIGKTRCLGVKRGKYRGTTYDPRKYKNKDGSQNIQRPWSKVWRTIIHYNKGYVRLGNFIDPISGETVYNLVFNEIYDGNI